MRIVRGTSDQAPERNYVEVSDGDAPSSAQVTINAKGAAQYELKFYLSDPDELVERAEALIVAAHTAILSALDRVGIPLAGQEAASKGK